VQQKKERPTHHKQQQKVPFQKHNTKEQNVWELWSDEIRVVVYSKHNSGRRGHREGERVHLL
jgi:hypothetical protein